MHKLFVIFSILFVTFLFLLAGCSSTGSYTSVEQLDSTFYDSATQRCIDYEGIERNPIIVVHGFLGARLVDSKTDRSLWGDFWGIDMLSISNERIRGLAHPMEYGKPLKDLKSDVVPKELLETVNVKCLGVSLKVTAYKKLIDSLTKAGFQPTGRGLPEDKHFYNLFEFAYDWRRDLPENARKLDLFIRQKKEYLKEKYKELYGVDNFDVQFDIIGHSMGGLLSRYYLRYGTQDLSEDGSLPKLDWYGSKNIDRLIIAGTPNAGYLDTFIEMLQGGGPQPLPIAALGTLPTYYQMLPAPETESIVYSDNGEPVDYFNPKLWKKMNWGIANSKEDKTLQILLPNVSSKAERGKIACDHLSKCLNRAKQFISAMSVKATPPDDVLLILVYGSGFKTTRRAFINRETGKIEKIEYSSGDGKVLASSALWDERISGNWSFFLRSPIDWDYLLGLRSAHMGILEAPVFEDNILVFLSLIESQKQKEVFAKTQCKIE